jgi:hypothetical protein
LAVATLAGLLLLASRCVPHPVGSARSESSYVRKARTTAERARSDVATVVVAANAAGEGKGLSPFVGLVVSDAEESVDGVSGTFRSIQPPDAASAALGEQLGGILDTALEHLTAVRIEARRGTLVGLEDVAAPLQDDLAQLDRFIEAQQ